MTYHRYKKTLADIAKGASEAAKIAQEALNNRRKKANKQKKRTRGEWFQELRHQRFNRAYEAYQVRTTENLTFSELGKRLGISSQMARIRYLLGKKLHAKVVAKGFAAGSKAAVTRASRLIQQIGLVEAKAMSDHEFLRMPEIGRTTLAEIRRQLKEPVAGPKIISKAEARDAGLTRYFTGKPCKHGHIAEYLVSSGQCLSCARVRTRARYDTRPDVIEARRLQDEYCATKEPWETWAPGGHARRAAYHAFLRSLGINPPGKLEREIDEKPSRK